MSERTARKYEHAGQLPSTLKQPRRHRTRPNPFAAGGPWIVGQLERDSALQATTLFALLEAQHPGRYRAGQVRTLQRHIATWRALHGPEREVMFAQEHTPGEMAQSDFTHMSDLGSTLGGVPFPHVLFHLVLTYSNVEEVSLCFAERFEALGEGRERTLWQIGGVPRRPRTDHLGAAVRPRFAVEHPLFRPLPTAPLAPCRELRVGVSRFSTIQVLGNTSSVPSRLIGTTLTVRVRAETVEA